MNPFDTDIVLFLNGFARRSWTFDWLVYVLDSNYIIKGGIMAALLLAVWFRETGDSEGTEDRRANIVAGLFAMCLAVLVARLLSFAFPFRGRLMYEPGTIRRTSLPAR